MFPRIRTTRHRGIHVRCSNYGHVCRQGSISKAGKDLEEYSGAWVVNILLIINVKISDARGAKVGMTRVRRCLLTSSDQSDHSSKLKR